MRPKEAVGQAERDYLRAVCELAAREPDAAVSFREVQEHLSYTDSQADECSDFWTRRGALEWPALGRLAPTRLGLVRAESLTEHQPPRGCSHYRPDWWPPRIRARTDS